MKRILSIIIVINLIVSCKKEDSKSIVCWGDSLTAPHISDNLKGRLKKLIKGDDSYPGVLENNLGNEYQIINCGVGGENTLTIMARQGAFPLKLAHDVIIFKSEKSKFTKFIGNSDIIAFKSTFNNEKLTPLLRGWKETGSSHFNPITINGNSFVIKSESQYWKEDKKYQFEYNYFIESNEVVSETDTLKKGSIIETNAMHTLRNAYANIFFMGQNEGFKDVAELIKQYKEMIKYSKSDKYIIIGYHKPNMPIPNIKRMIQMEDSLSNAFGNNYINLRSYLVKNGLKDANLIPTQIDTDSIIKNQVPPQLMTDGTHFTSIGYKLIGNLVTERFKKLGY
jgi:lysophospholipase L1-like esterase